MLTAHFSPAVSARPEPLPAGVEERHLPIHTLSGEYKRWADRLLALFKGLAVDGIEWSLKLQPSGLTANRFLLGLQRENLSRLDFKRMPAELAMPPAIWSAVLRELPQAEALYIAFEPTESAFSYRLYVEPPAVPLALRRQGVGFQACGYKWDPRAGGAGVVTRYREQVLDSREAFGAAMESLLAGVSHDGMRSFSRALLSQACAQADPAGFLVMAADETGSARDSCTVTFTGTSLSVQAWVPELIRLAEGAALPVGDVMAAFVADDPRDVRSLAFGRARDGEEFVTFYYG